MATSFALPVRRRSAASCCSRHVAALAVAARSAAGLLRLAAQAVRPAAPRARLLRRPADRRGRRRPRRVDDLSLRHRHLRPGRHGGLRDGLWQRSSGSRSGRRRSPSGPPTARVFAYWHIVPAVRNGEYAVAYRTMLGRIAKGWGARPLRRARRRPLREPAATGRARPLRGHDAPDGARVQLRAARQGARPHSRSRGGSTWSPRRRTRLRWSCRGSWADRPVMPALVHWRLVGAAGAEHPDGERRVDFSLRPSRHLISSTAVYATVDAPEPCPGVTAATGSISRGTGTVAPGPTAAIGSKSLVVDTARQPLGLVDAVLGRRTDDPLRNEANASVTPSIYDPALVLPAVSRTRLLELMALAAGALLVEPRVGAGAAARTVPGAPLGAQHRPALQRRPAALRERQPRRPGPRPGVDPLRARPARDRPARGGADRASPPDDGLADASCSSSRARTGSGGSPTRRSPSAPT